MSNVSLTSEKPKLSFWQIWNMSFGFLGIQFGFALQGGFMSSIFQSLGATKDELPGLWIAAPLTGLIVQPIIGYLSDRTWSPRWGRRRPFFLIGAISSSIALFFVPYSSALWMAAGFLWIMDASINISMEPFRALVADKLPSSQRSYGFVMQTIIIGVGTWVASKLPLIVSYFGVSDATVIGSVSDSVKVAFGIGGMVFLLSILFTVFTTDEYPPEDLEAFKAEKEASKGFLKGIKEILGSISGMPLVMKQLGIVQFFSWFGFFTMWSMAQPALTEHVFKSPYGSEGYGAAANQVGSYMGTYGLTSMVYALILAFVTSRMKINRRMVHLGSLITGGIGFISMYFISDPSMLYFSFGCIGVAWASILSMPYAMLSSSIDSSKMGIYMGLFNMFIVIPQVVAAIGGINFMYRLVFGDAVINTMLLAGSSLIIAGLANLIITDKKVISG